MAGLNSKWEKALDNIAKQGNSISGATTVNIGVVMAELATVTRQMIDMAPFPGGVKNAIKNGISSVVLNETTGMLTVSAIRPSIINAGSVNLARSYHDGWAVTNPRAYYKGIYNGENVFIRFAETPGFSGHSGSPFLDMAARRIMAKYPGVHISVS